VSYGIVRGDPERSGVVGFGPLPGSTRVCGTCGLHAAQQGISPHRSRQTG